jgi:hypothetical protein
MTEPFTIEQGRTFLAERRESLRVLYARMRESGATMLRKGIVCRSKERGYFADYSGGLTRAEREAVKNLLALQRNIEQQAMLLLELEHSLDEETKKRETVDRGGD